MTSREHLEERAAHWIMRQEEPGFSSEDRDELQHWLEESVAHQAAYWRLEHGWKLVDAALGEEPVPRPFMRRLVAIPSRRVLHWSALAASLLLTISIGATWFAHYLSRPVETVEYSTARGERGVLRLADGSQIELNTETSIRIARSGDGRAVWLDRGEAFFSVAHDPEHPFVVHSGARNVTVLGTKFNIQRESGHMVVAVVEGRVRLADPADAQNLTSVVIARGDMAMVNGTSTLIASGAQARIERELLWRRGVLSFDDTRLSEAVRQFNRYNRTQLVIDDPQLANIRIGGTFRTSNAESFAGLLEDAYGIDMRREGDKIILSKN